MMQPASGFLGRAGDVRESARAVPEADNLNPLIFSFQPVDEPALRMDDGDLARFQMR